MRDLESKIEYLKRLAPGERRIQQFKIEARMGLKRGDLDEKFGRVTQPTPAPVPATEIVAEEVVEKKKKAPRKKRTPKRKT